MEKLVSFLASARWVISGDLKVTKKEHRGISLLPQFKYSVNRVKGIVFAQCNCSFHRETKIITKIDSNLKEREIDIQSINLQLEPSQYKEFLDSIVPNEVTEKVMAPVVVKCENLAPDIKCKECNGSGRVLCEYCNGWGDHECRDCKGEGVLFPDKLEFREYAYQTHYGTLRDKERFQSTYPNMYCPACNGTGHFHCKVCNGSGSIICSSCNGSGHKFRNGSTQKITEMIETYSLDRTCALIISDENYNYPLEDDILKEDIVNSTPIIFRGEIETDDMKSLLSEIGRYSPSTCSDIKNQLKNPNLLSMHLVSHELDDLLLLSFRYDSLEYEILIIDNLAFTHSFPEISFFEKILGTYKKKL